jgi:hypothetical protein
MFRRFSRWCGGISSVRSRSAGAGISADDRLSAGIVPNYGGF